MARPPLSVDAVRELRAALSAFGEGTLARRRDAFAHAAGAGFADAQALVDYHDLMLFVLAHPATMRERALARDELRRVADAARTITARARRPALRETGLAWTSVRARFGLAFARWLVARHPGLAALDAIDDDPVRRAAVIARRSRDASRHRGRRPPRRHGDPRGLRRRRRPARVARAHVRRAGRAARGARAAVRIDRRLDGRSLADSALSRTFHRGPAGRPYAVARLVRSFDLAATLDAPARARAIRERHARGRRRREPRRDRGARPRDRRDGDDDRARHRGARARPRARDRAARARAGACRRLRRARGLRALPQRRSGGLRRWLAVRWRLPNRRQRVPGLPRRRVGVAVRAGAARVPATLPRRAVRRRALFWRAGNREGLESGAFWFYWRLGFRPVVPRVRALAEAEAAKIAADRAYRAPIATLRRFTTSDIARCRSRPRRRPTPRTSRKTVLRRGSRRDAGDASRAERAALRMLERVLGRRAPADGPARVAWRAWAPLRVQVPALARWPGPERARIAAMLSAKGRDEFAFQRRLAQAPRLARALAALAERSRAGV